ncbi:hypothetical protein BYT27DRAFT_7333532 [Phlegmacium glaucopus]|nr:hypothetical protein BYT27DRAFT_7333532 [Phlegmacium glaucopus]
MPYSLPVHSQGRAGHRRSYSHITATPPLTDLPRRRSSFNNIYPNVTPKKPTFHINEDDDDSSHDEAQRRDADNGDDDDEEEGRLRGLPPLRLKLNPNSFNAVPFPLSSPPLHPSSPTPVILPRPPLSRTTSLSNGKPLKSSLKSSSSSPNIPFPPQSLVPSIMFPDLHPGYYKHHQSQHHRASSAPCTPLLDEDSPSSPLSTSPPSSLPSSQNHSPSSSFHHHTPKNVHFPSQEEGGLATIRVFNRSARPASLSRLGEETETETEGEGSGAGGGNIVWTGWSGGYVGGSTYPFPRVAPSSGEKEKKSPLNPSSSAQRQKPIPYEIDWSHSSLIPRKNINLGNENVFFESLKVVDSDPTRYLLQGTVLVRNITYQKTVMVRYTMDEWETVNDVLGWYDVGGVSGGNGTRGGWDRFKFSIALCDDDLEGKVVWLVGKYVGGGGAAANGASPEGATGGEGTVGAGEWWDNNEGKNYRVGFKKLDQAKVEEEKESPYKRGVVVSAPPTYTGLTPTSTLTRPKLSAPQISSSSSFPATRFSGQYQYQLQLQNEKEKERMKAQHQAALTQSTLARLKKLNLKNYAAPKGYGYGQQLPSSAPANATTPPLENLTAPPVLTLTSATPTISSFVEASSESPPSSGSGSGLPYPPLEESPIAANFSSMEMTSPTLSTSSTDLTSADSTPLQTPTQDDDEGGGGEGLEKGLGDAEEESQNLRWSLSIEHGHFATTIIPPTAAPTAGTPTSSSTPTPIPIQGVDTSYARTTYPYTNAGVEMGTSPPFSDLEGSVRAGIGRGSGGSVHWDWGSAAGALGGVGVGGEKEARKEVPWMNHHQQHQSLSLSGGGGGLMPPQRRRVLHHHHQQQQQQRGSGGSSSSGSGSDSKSKSGSKLPAAPSSPPSIPSSSSPLSSSSSTPTVTSPLTTPSPIPPKQKAIPPKLNLPAAPKFISPVATGGLQSPYYPGSARRGYYHEPHSHHQQQQQQRYGHRHFNSMPATVGGGPTLPPTPGSASNDAIYQALVREWCFAQGPGPVVGSIGVLSASGETTPVGSGTSLGLGGGELGADLGRLTSPLGDASMIKLSLIWEVGPWGLFIDFFYPFLRRLPLSSSSSTSSIIDQHRHHHPTQPTYIIDIDKSASLSL